MKGFHLHTESRSISYSIILGVWGIVALYAALHDLYLVRIAPQHFTVYHPPMWGLTEPVHLALGYAFRASLGPGFVLGIACLFVARGGRLPKTPIRTVLGGIVIVVIVTEVVAALAGWHAHATGRAIYPAALYPDSSHAMLITTTIQYTCYLAAALFSGIFLILLWASRNRSHRNDRQERNDPEGSNASPEPRSTDPS